MISPWLFPLALVAFVLSYRSRKPERQLDFALFGGVLIFIAAIGMASELIIG